MTTRELTRLGAEIRRRRLIHGWTLEQFAEVCKLSPNYLGTIEAGRRDVHTSTLMSIARALGCTISDLLTDPTTDLSAASREIAEKYDRASPEAKDVVERMLRVLDQPQKPSASSKDGASSKESEKAPRRRGRPERSS